MDGRIAAIVVAHDSGADLAAAVDCLLASADIAELQVVDNGSRDGAIERLPADPRLRVLRNAGNPGFAVACNQGARATRAPLLAFVNPDCFVEPDTLARLRAVIDADPGIGLLGADVRDAAGAIEPAARRRDPSLVRVLGQALGAGSLHVPPGPAGGVTTVDATSGALMLLPRSAFERAGGFDEGYRLHAEDLDLCRRVRAQGLRVAVAEGVPVRHLKGTSSRRRPLFVAFHKHRGLARYWLRWGAGGGMPGTALAVALAWLRFAALAPLAAWREYAARRP
jgi:N-acetylglucosaminyl-diphospho-decaprenol L-rhamnosyltransferase